MSKIFIGSEELIFCSIFNVMKSFSNLLIIFVLLVGCKKPTPDQVPPEIAFSYAQLSEDNAYCQVGLTFYDQDGDLGLKKEETTAPYDYSVFVEYFEKHNGQWEKKSPILVWNNNTSQFDTAYLHSRMPYIENDIQLVLEGKIDIDLLYNFTADTFRYEIFIQDRALTKSNTIVTDEVVVP